MSKKIKKTGSSTEDEKFPLPVYKTEEDVYTQGKKESLEDENKPLLSNSANNNNALGGDLDIPGSELDDANEGIGEEDEENNYYSLGGDDHEDLENDQGI